MVALPAHAHPLPGDVERAGVAVRGLLVEALQPVLKGANVRAVLEEVGDVPSGPVTFPNERVDVDVAGLVAHPLPRVWQLNLRLACTKPSFKSIEPLSEFTFRLLSD